MLTWTPRHKHRIEFRIPGGPTIALNFAKPQGQAIRFSVECPDEVAIVRLQLEEVLTAAGLTLAYVPSPDPETNPCEPPPSPRSKSPSTPSSPPSRTPSTAPPTPRLSRLLRKYGDGPSGD